MSTRRCPRCLENWPTGEDYKRCPACLGLTDWVADAHPMLQRELKQRLYEIACEKIDAEREKRGEETPEQRGRTEAHEILALERIWDVS